MGIFSRRIANFRNLRDQAWRVIEKELETAQVLHIYF
jgi:adenosyl cobinamide kinase/adenosyl cobinamide phosphate guanylyltransferase